MAKFEGWVPLREASEKCGIHYITLFGMVKRGVFTRGRFTDAAQSRIYLRVDELEAWKKGGIDAVAALKSNPDHPAFAADLGGEGG